MMLDRRQAVAVGAFAPFALAQAAGAHGRPAAPARLFHVFAGPDARSHIERVDAPTSGSRDLPVAAVTMTTIRQGVEDWHNAPFKTFTLNLTGNIQAMMGDGTTASIGPGDLVYLEDLTGKGHVTRLLTEVTCLFLRMPPDFDFRAWLKG